MKYIIIILLDREETEYFFQGMKHLPHVLYFIPIQYNHIQYDP